MDLAVLPPRFCRSEELRSCCGRRAVDDAVAVAVKLGILHCVVDFRRPFEERVVADFCAEYAAGRTPNPCVRCISSSSSGSCSSGPGGSAPRPWPRVIMPGSTATPPRGAGSSARGSIRTRTSPIPFPLTQTELARTLFPLGGLTKSEVRARAAAASLPVAEKPESQEICFVPDDDYAGFLRERCPGAFRPGPIVDAAGRVIGAHDGIAHFTVGQRKGMGIAAPRPLNVLRVDVERNTIVAGPSEALYGRSLEAGGMNWISIDRLTGPLDVRARIRYKHAEAAARVEPAGPDRVRVEFVQPQRAIAPRLVRRFL